MSDEEAEIFHFLPYGIFLAGLFFVVVVVKKNIVFEEVAHYVISIQE